MMPDAIQISDEHYAQMESHVVAEAPLEACGLLAGEGKASRAAYPIRNQAQSATRFLMDASQQVAAFVEIEEQGWELLAIYHSHPAGPSGPSQTDLAEALYPDTFQLIWSRATSGAWQCRAYNYEEGMAREIGIKLGQE